MKWIKLSEKKPPDEACVAVRVCYKGDYDLPVIVHYEGGEWVDDSGITFEPGKDDLWCEITW